MTDASRNWIDNEASGCHLVDRRLDRRLHRVPEHLSDALGESLPLACQDWANTKAAYRFSSNDRVGEGDILAGHFEATRRRVAAALGVILVLQDTTEFSFERDLGTHFLVRTCVDRLAGDGTTTVAHPMGEMAVGSRHRIAVLDAAGGGSKPRRSTSPTPPCTSGRRSGRRSATPRST